MGCPEADPGRAIWEDYNARQQFEHTLIDRKTTWLLTTESILLTAFALSFEAGSDVKVFRVVLCSCAILFAVTSWFGVWCLIRSKKMSWEQYKCYFKMHNEEVRPPEPFASGPLEWGVQTKNTKLSLSPDWILPLIFIAAWGVLLTWSLRQ